jgi:hypothetical protein
MMDLTFTHLDLTPKVMDLTQTLADLISVTVISPSHSFCSDTMKNFGEIMSLSFTAHQIGLGVAVALYTVNT